LPQAVHALTLLCSAFRRCSHQLGVVATVHLELGTAHIQVNDSRQLLF
jgi:hypothetical protein